MTTDTLVELLLEQRALQRELGCDPGQMTDAARVAWVKEMYVAAVRELGEVLDETTWKPWTVGTPRLAADALVGELVDVLQFWMNLLFTARPDLAAADLAALVRENHRRKLAVNRARHRSGTYDGRSTKCPICGRASDEWPGAVTDLDGVRLCNGCGATWRPEDAEVTETTETAEVAASEAGDLDLPVAAPRVRPNAGVDPTLCLYEEHRLDARPLTRVGDSSGTAVLCGTCGRRVGTEDPATGLPDPLRCPVHGDRFTLVSRTPGGRRLCRRGDAWRFIDGGFVLAEMPGSAVTGDDFEAVACPRCGSVLGGESGCHTWGQYVIRCANGSACHVAAAVTVNGVLCPWHGVSLARDPANDARLCPRGESWLLVYGMLRPLNWS